MRIVVDVSPLSHPRTGIGNYLRGMVGALAGRGAGRHEVCGFAPTSLRGLARIREALAGTGVRVRLVPLPWSHAVRTGWSRLGHPAAELVAGRFDAFVFSDWMFPPQRGGVRATVIHDLVPLHRPEWCTPRTVSMHTTKYDNARRTCDVVFANSRYTADDVIATLGLPASRVVVAYPGLGSGYRPDGPRLELDEPYVLGVGTLEPRKNLAALVAAWRELSDDVQLVLAGAAGWGDAKGLDDGRIVKLGYVPDGELPRLYRGASAFVYPSRLEGFGIPIVEAMACGTPVVASSHPSLDEASGDAAVRADPERPDEIADAIRRAIAEPAALRAAGLEHASRFSWAVSADVILGALEERS